MGAASSGYRAIGIRLFSFCRRTDSQRTTPVKAMSVAAIDVHEGWLTPGKRTAAGGDEPLATARDDTAFASALASLTKRQRQIVHLRARGLTITEICDHCFLSENTVKNHLHGAFRTLGLGGLRHQRGSAGPAISWAGTRRCERAGRQDESDVGSRELAKAISRELIADSW